MAQEVDELITGAAGSPLPKSEAPPTPQPRVHREQEALGGCGGGLSPC